MAVYPAVLYVWAGQNASVSNAADFVAVIDFTESSSTYGQILKIVSLVSDPTNGIGQANNEAHHSGISLDGKYYVTGGLLSFLSNQKEVFVWSIPSNPVDGPKFLYAIDIPGACTDAFVPIGDAKFLVSMMCNDSAVSPGNIGLLDADARTATSFLNNASALVGFNPHGFTRLNDGDYIEPATLVGNDPSKIIFRNTARYFSADGNLLRTFQFTPPTAPGSTSGVGQGTGFMDLKTIPNDPLQRSFTCGTNTNILYLIGPGIIDPVPIFDLAQVNNNIRRLSAGIYSVSTDGTKLLMTFQMRFDILFDISQPANPIILQVFDFCSDNILNNIPILNPDTSQNTTFRQFCATNNNMTGTHVLIHPDGERRFIVINYFLKFGLAQLAGTRTVHVFKLNTKSTSFTYQTQFNPNFQFNQQQSLTFNSLNSFPHHAQYLKL